MKAKLILELEITLTSDEMKTDAGTQMSEMEMLAAIKEDFEADYGQALTDYEPELTTVTVAKA